MHVCMQHDWNFKSDEMTKYCINIQVLQATERQK